MLQPSSSTTPSTPATGTDDGSTVGATTTEPVQPATTAAQTPPTGPGLPPSPPPSQPVVTGGGSVATGLSALPGCEGTKPLTRLSWQPAGANVQVVAVSARPDGLESGNYTTSEELPGDHAAYELRDSQPGGVYYWRVLTRDGDVWAASATAQFEGPTCVAF
ncbi:MAG: hypothetical protein QOD63_1748 [Actinomycetota bacterium]|nr:hypothetical protein [Actinomycetota bacterium]